MTLSFNVKATHRNVFIKGSATTKATIPRSENLSVMGLNQFIFTVMTGSRNRRKAVDYSVKCTKFSRYAFLPAWPITRLLRVRRAIKEYCKSSSGVLAILVLVLARSANVQTKPCKTINTGKTQV